MSGEKGAGFGKGGFGDKGKGKAKGKGKSKKGGKKGKGKDEATWIPCTKLGRLVEEGLLTSIEDIYLHGLPIKEYQIVDRLIERAGNTIQDAVMKIHPVQKMTSAGQRNRFVVYVLVGDLHGHIGVGQKCSKEVANAIRGGLIAAKLNMIPVRRGYWGNKLGAPHTVPMKVTGKCGSVRVRLIPAPRGTRVVGSPTLKKILMFAGITDCFSSSSGHTKTKGNYIKATFEALKATYGYLTPDLWKKHLFPASPYQVHSDFLASRKKMVVEA